MSVRQARQDFPLIREDGFNTIILVVPWRGLQTEQFPPRYEKSYFKLLRQLLREARRARLWVILRVSYAHHICDEASLISKHLTARLLTDSAYQAPWLDHLHRLRRCTRFASNLRGEFLSWEEFWHGLMRFCEEPEQARRELAASTGYNRFMGRQAGIIPAQDEPGFEDYQAFINVRLRELFELGKQALPGLGYEFRVDKDPVQRSDGSVDWLQNDYFADSDILRYSYWAPFIGAANQGEQLTAEQALGLLEYNLKEQTREGINTRLIVDQFNFVDDTFKYSGSNARLAQAEIEPFLQGSAQLLRDHCTGYGIWAWRDYLQNHLFNPGFGLGLKGWQVHAGKVRVKTAAGGSLRLSQGGEVGQAFGGPSHGMHRKYKTSHVELVVNCDSVRDLVLEATIDGSSYHPLLADAAGVFRASLPLDDGVYGKRGVDFRLRALAGSGRLLDVCLYQHAYRVGIRTTDGAPGAYLRPVIQLNTALASLPGEPVK